MVSRFALLLTVCLFAGHVSCKDVVCYVPTWIDISSKIDPSLCSIYVLAFGSVDASGNVELPQYFTRYKTALKKPRTKLMLGIGGLAYTAEPWVLQQISASETSRQAFATNCLNLAKSSGLNGFDIHWEYPDSSDRDNFVALHQELKDKLGDNYLLSTSVAGGQLMVNIYASYDIANLANTVDFINIMAYNMHMDQNFENVFGVNFNAPVNATKGNSIEQTIKSYIQGGAPASKLMLGVPFFGRMFQLANSGQNNTPGSAFNGGHQWADDSYTPDYNEYCSNFTSSIWTKKFDATAQVPYMYSGNLWFSYEDSNSITIKGKLANKYNLGGVMAWTLNQDDYDGVCSKCKWTLLKALNAAIGRGRGCNGGNSSPSPHTPTTRKSSSRTTKHKGTPTTTKKQPRTTTRRRKTTTPSNEASTTAEPE